MNQLTKTKEGIAKDCPTNKNLIEIQIKGEVILSSSVRAWNILTPTTLQPI